MVRTYNAGKVSVIFGPNILSGFADGSFVNCERNEDSWAHKVGTDGKSTRAKSNNESGTITLTLDQASPSNDVLSALMAADEASGAGVLPVLVRDASGRFLAGGESAWISKPAPSEFGRESLDREWVFQVANLKMNVGGN